MVAYHLGPTLNTFWGLILIWSLIVLAVIDFEHTLLPDDITLPFLWLGLLINSFECFTTANAAILGAISGYLALWTVFWTFKLLTRKEGMGYGDFKLLAMLGAWLGWQALPMIILISSFLGSVVGISLILLQKKNKNSHIPFGPFLSIGGFCVLLLHPHLHAIYFKLFTL
jgi:leader peptidase (prepilin peptidase)/N-methyltransferase